MYVKLTRVYDVLAFCFIYLVVFFFRFITFIKPNGKGFLVHSYIYIYTYSICITYLYIYIHSHTDINIYSSWCAAFASPPRHTPGNWTRITFSLIDGWKPSVGISNLHICFCIFSPSRVYKTRRESGRASFRLEVSNISRTTAVAHKKMTFSGERRLAVEK